MPIIIHKKYLPDIDLDTSSFVYEGNFILIQDEYITNILKCMNVPEINEDQFYLICGAYLIDYPEVLECYALKSARNAYYYAIYVLEGRFELGENTIATNETYMAHYHLYVSNINV